MKNDKEKLKFFWKLTADCPFMCPYCPDIPKRNISKILTNRLLPEEWIFYWKLIYDKYGTCEIVLLEEPLSYPELEKLISMLQEIHYPIHISTALSREVDFIINALSPARVRIHARFHPLFITSEDFLRRMLALKMAKFQIHVSILAYPLYLDNIPIYMEEFRRKALNEYLKVDPYVGEYRGARYPESYSPQMRKYLGLSEFPEEGWHLDSNGNGKKGQEEMKNLCRWGVKDIYISETGDIWRCPVIGPVGIIGNFFDIDFKVLDISDICGRENDCQNKREYKKDEL